MSSIGSRHSKHSSRDGPGKPKRTDSGAIPLGFASFIKPEKEGTGNGSHHSHRSRRSAQIKSGSIQSSRSAKTVKTNPNVPPAQEEKVGGTGANSVHPRRRRSRDSHHSSKHSVGKKTRKDWSISGSDSVNTTSTIRNGLEELPAFTVEEGDERVAQNDPNIPDTDDKVDVPRISVHCPTGSESGAGGKNGSSKTRKPAAPTPGSQTSKMDPSHASQHSAHQPNLDQQQQSVNPAEGASAAAPQQGMPVDPDKFESTHGALDDHRSYIGSRNGKTAKQNDATTNSAGSKTKKDSQPLEAVPPTGVTGISADQKPSKVPADNDILADQAPHEPPDASGDPKEDDLLGKLGNFVLDKVEEKAQEWIRKDRKHGARHDRDSPKEESRKHGKKKASENEAGVFFDEHEHEHEHGPGYPLSEDKVHFAGPAEPLLGNEASETERNGRLGKERRRRGRRLITEEIRTKDECNESRLSYDFKRGILTKRSTRNDETNRDITSLEPEYHRGEKLPSGHRTHRRSEEVTESETRFEKIKGKLIPELIRRSSSSTTTVIRRSRNGEDV